jgi:hypothetical protein
MLGSTFARRQRTAAEWNTIQQQQRIGGKAPDIYLTRMV